MPAAMEQDAMECAFRAVHDSNVQSRAKYMKHRFDQKYGRKWHCICGSDYSSWVHPTRGTYIHFRIGEQECELFKAGT